ncbi:hypothetical protein [Hymenobacter terricola]|uniref:hypothetical protein n=1 Tax=Hymenobacter terricola TaxID=2819236 RepID=UPI001B312504|nr:hypothetical protein [Hymenobacter terricola]
MSDTLTTADSAAAPAPAAPAPRPRRHWGRWLLGALALLVVLVLVALQLLDPWLRRTLEKQVTKQTHGQYRLQVGALHTSLWHGAIRLRNLRLRPAATVADTLPRVRLDVARLNVTGVGLWALLRKQLVPIDSVVLDSAHIQVLALARKPTKPATQPLHERLPLKLPGLRIGYFGLLHVQARYEPAAQPSGSFKEADLSARDLLISRAGAADTQRIAYAAAWQLGLLAARAEVASHHLTLGALRFSTASQRLQLDSLRIKEPAPGQGKPGAVRVNFTMPRLAATGIRAATWLHQRHFRADSLVLKSPKLAFKPPTKRPPDFWKLLAPVARRADVAHLALHNGQMRVTGLAHTPSIVAVNVTGTGIRVDSVAKQASDRVAYARAWTAHTGRLQAAFDAPNYQASSAHLRLNTAAHTLSMTGLALLPNLTPVQMNLRVGYQIPQFTAHLPELTIAGLDFALLVRHGDVHAARVTVRRPLLAIASDGRGPINPHRSIITPEDMRKVQTRIDVRRLDLVNGNLTTRYRSPLSPVVGTLSINRFSGSLYNVSNEPRHQTAATPLTGTATAWLQNTCRMTVHLAVPLLDPSGRHRVWGNFGPGSLAILNSMTVPTRLVDFKKGNVQGINFALQADKKQVTGTMTTRYTGLQLELLSYKKGEIKQSLGKKIISKAANVLVIRDQNPRKDGRVVTGDMTSKREPRFSVFVLWRQGIVSGLLNNIGLPRALARKLSESEDVAPLPTTAR